MIDTLRVLQWNAARSLAAIHSLTPLIANNPQPPHLLLIQELLRPRGIPGGHT